MKIAQISDVHSRSGGAAAGGLEAAPDLIVMTGDLVNREDQDLSRALSLADGGGDRPGLCPRQP